MLGDVYKRQISGIAVIRISGKETKAAIKVLTNQELKVVELCGLRYQAV